jgi:hypothetical protein
MLASLTCGFCQALHRPTSLGWVTLAPCVRDGESHGQSTASMRLQGEPCLSGGDHKRGSSHVPGGEDGLITGVGYGCVANHDGIIIFVSENAAKAHGLI